MIEVKVIVEIPGLPEAIHALAGALSNTAAPAKNVADTQPVTYMNTAPAQAVTVPDSGSIASATDAPGANPTQQGTNVPGAVVTTAQSGPAQQSSHSETATLTLDDIGRAGASLIDAGKMPQLIALLGKYGVQAVTQLKPEHFNAFADELKAHGAKF